MALSLVDFNVKTLWPIISESFWQRVNPNFFEQKEFQDIGHHFHKEVVSIEQDKSKKVFKKQSTNGWHLTLLEIKKNGVLDLEIYCNAEQIKDVYVLNLEEGAQLKIKYASASKSIGEMHILGRFGERNKFNLIYHAVVGKGAHNVHSAHLTIQPMARECAIEQRAHVLKEKDCGIVKCKPELVIKHDQVRAQHGVAVGGFDTEKVQYLKSRGLTDFESYEILKEAHLLATFEHQKELV